MGVLYSKPPNDVFRPLETWSNVTCSFNDSLHKVWRGWFLFLITLTPYGTHEIMKCKTIYATGIIWPERVHAPVARLDGRGVELRESTTAHVHMDDRRSQSRKKRDNLMMDRKRLGKMIKHLQPQIQHDQPQNDDNQQSESRCPHPNNLPT